MLWWGRVSILNEFQWYEIISRDDFLFFLNNSTESSIELRLCDESILDELYRMVQYFCFADSIRIYIQDEIIAGEERLRQINLSIYAVRDHKHIIGDGKSTKAKSIQKYMMRTRERRWQVRIQPICNKVSHHHKIRSSRYPIYKWRKM